MITLISNLRLSFKIKIDITLARQNPNFPAQKVAPAQKQYNASQNQ